MKNKFGRTEKNWYLPQLPLGTKVEFELTPEIKGTGTITGISSTDIVIIGKTYIIQLDELFPDYEYTHIACPEIFLKTI